MRRLALLAVSIPLSGCFFGPFSRGVEDTRDPAWRDVAHVDSSGVFFLDDGRRVRVFGVRVPPEAEPRKKMLDRLRSVVHRGYVSCETVLPATQDEPAAVDLTVHEPGFFCGNVLMTWNPFERPLRLYYDSEDLGDELSSTIPGALSDVDLERRIPFPERAVALRLNGDHLRAKTAAFELTAKLEALAPSFAVDQARLARYLQQDASSLAFHVSDAGPVGHASGTRRHHYGLALQRLEDCRAALRRSWPKPPHAPPRVEETLVLIEELEAALEDLRKRVPHRNWTR